MDDLQTALEAWFDARWFRELAIREGTYRTADEVAGAHDGAHDAYRGLRDALNAHIAGAVKAGIQEAMTEAVRVIVAEPVDEDEKV